MFQAIRQDPQRQRLHPSDGLLARLPVSQHAGQLRHLGQPAPIFFTLDFDLQIHGDNIRD